MKQFKVIAVDESGMLDEQINIIKANDITEAVKNYCSKEEVEFEEKLLELGNRVYKNSVEGYAFYFIECKFI